MKRTFIIFCFGLFLFGCADKKAQEKALVAEILKTHDKVMGVDEKLQDNKMKLDTMIKQGKLAANDTAKMLVSKLSLADSAMDVWMNNFHLDYKGKTEEETVAYMAGQKKQIMAIDSQITASIAESSKYLLKIKEK
jgi:hypothetical protein